jgi:hypothetical protein
VHAVDAGDEKVPTEQVEQAALPVPWLALPAPHCEHELAPSAPATQPCGQALQPPCPLWSWNNPGEHLPHCRCVEKGFDTPHGVISYVPALHVAHVAHEARLIAFVNLPLPQSSQALSCDAVPTTAARFPAGHTVCATHPVASPDHVPAGHASHVRSEAPPHVSTPSTMRDPAPQSLQAEQLACPTMLWNLPPAHDVQARLRLDVAVVLSYFPEAHASLCAVQLL